VGNLQVTTSGAQVVGGPQASGGGSFPTGVKTIQLPFNPDPLGYSVETGDVLQLQSPSAFVTVPGVGAAPGPVTQGLALLLSVNVPIKVRMTMADPGGGSDIVSIVPLNGPMLIQFPPNGYLKLLELEGSATVEYHVWGIQ